MRHGIGASHKTVSLDKAFMNHRAVTPLTLVAILAVGCQGGSEALQVTGTVKHKDGAAVDAQQGGKVLFMPIEVGKGATGSVEPDGTFTMMTERPGDGVTPGNYKVVLQIWKDYRAGTLAVPEKYGDAATTPLEATVDSDHTHFDFVIEP
jgi:hypothetical protein